MTTARERLLELAHALGHVDPAIWETRGGRFFASCGCGWESTTKAVLVEALRAGVAHAIGAARPVAAKAKRSGRPLALLIADARENAEPPKHPATRDRFQRVA